MKPFPKFGFGQKIFIVFAVAAAAMFVFSLVFYASGSPLTVPKNETGGYTVNHSSGLELIAQTSSYEIHQGNDLSISIKVLNTRSVLNVLNITRDFPQLANVYRFSVNPCDYAPFGIAIAQGDYGLNNLRVASPLDLFEPGILSCPLIPIVSQYQFLSHSSEAKMYNPNDNPSIIGTFDFSATLNLSGYWASSSEGYTFQTFPAGIYTIIAADGWGQVVVLHFLVS